MIIDNQGAGAVVGTFSGLPQGQSFVATNGVSYTISYTGGTGNDVVLTQTGKGVTVLAGVDRVETAVNVSKNSFPAAGSANAVVLARGDLFPDALAGSPLAVAKGGPLLLTSLVASTGIDVRTTAEIQRVLSPGKTIFILGGEVAISAAVATQLQGLGYTIVRLGGADRFDTAILIASNGLNNPANILLATGLNFPDALAAGAAAAKVNGAVLLTNGTVQPPANQTYLSAHPSDVLFALGGPAAVAVPTAQSISGVDRYDTAVKVAQKFFTSPTTVGLASGVNFPDGLTGGAHIGRHRRSAGAHRPERLARVHVQLPGERRLDGHFGLRLRRHERHLDQRGQFLQGGHRGLRAHALRLIVAAAVGAAGLIASSADPAAAADSVIRLGGEDRIETSVAISQASYPKAGSAKAVVIARADDFADALAGTPFAVHVGGPLLVTGKGSLDVRVNQEIQRVLSRERRGLRPGRAGARCRLSSSTGSSGSGSTPCASRASIASTLRCRSHSSSVHRSA